MSISHLSLVGEKNKTKQKQYDNYQVSLLVIFKQFKLSLICKYSIKSQIRSKKGNSLQTPIG